MYVSFVLVLFKFFRTAFIDGRMVLVYVEELPCVDHLLVLFDQMFMAREMKDYWLEEELVAKLIFILRSPDVLFRITRMPQEVAKPPSEKNKTKRDMGLADTSDRGIRPLSGDTLFNPTIGQNLFDRLMVQLVSIQMYNVKK